MEEHHEPINMIELGQAIVETEDEIVDDTNSSPTKKIKVGSRNKSAMQAKWLHSQNLVLFEGFIFFCL